MVFAVDPYSMVSMVTGNYKEQWSPEERNARPFVHLLPQHQAAGAGTPPTPPQQ
jgi:hypothetical protein